VLPHLVLVIQVVALWPNGAPGFERLKNEPELARDYWVRHINNPSITVYLPPKDKATGAAVVICPGGGFRELVFQAEGDDPARFFNTLGIAAFVLKYRLPQEEGSPYSLDNVRQDGMRAMRLVRSRAVEWGVDPHKIGLMGFSAGGSVASLVTFTLNAGDSASRDPVERQNARPDFLIMIYPGPLGIPDSLPPSVPPAFLLAADDDPCCSESTVKLLRAYRAAKISVEAHIFARGGHAFNMGYRSSLATIKGWPQRLADWLADNSL
jgi:acetyl esterase/lipase